MRAGQGIFLKLNYADGGSPNYERPFLIMRIEEDKIYMLNISSVRGKEYKLGFKSNHNIRRYRPPFRFPSFVKLDAVYAVENSRVLENYILDEGRAIDSLEFNAIYSQFNTYKANNKINSCYHCVEDVLSLNNILITDQVIAAEKDKDD